jgi:hypothetical protein
VPDPLLFPLKNLEALVESIGDAVAEAGGMRFTRLAEAAEEGDVEATVETTEGWPNEGSFYCAGTKHTYSGKDLAHLLNVDPPFPADRRVLTSVVDASRTFSGLDLVRNMIFVDTAEGVYLDALSRNYGLDRPEGVSDAVWRAVVKAIAFSPKGTAYVLELLLDAILGEGTYEIFEDLENYPNVVFIRLLDEDALTTGKSYFAETEEVSSSTTTTVVASNAPVGDSRDSVTVVRLAADYAEVSGDVLPSAEPDTAWTYTGTTAEGTVVTVNGDGTVKLEDTSGTEVGARYERALRVDVQSEIVVEWEIELLAYDVLFLPAGALEAASGCFVRVHDGTGEIFVGITDTDVWFGSDLTVSTALSAGRHRFTLRKPAGIEDGYPANQAVVELWIDGVKALSRTYDAVVGASALRKIEFGSMSVKATSEVDWHDLRVSVKNGRNYWNTRFAEDSDVDVSDPDEIVSAAAAFVAADVGRTIIVRPSENPVFGSTAHGRNNGAYKIASVDAADTITVTGIPYKGGTAEGDTFALDEEQHDVFTAEDAGVQASFQTGTGANGITWKARYGGDDGNLLKIAIIAVANNPSIQTSVVVSGSERHIEVRPVANAGSVIQSTAEEVVEAVNANTSFSAIAEASLVGDGSGVVAAVASTFFADGEDGKLLTISGSALGNNGTRKLATLVDERTVLLGSHLSIPAMTEESGLTWQKDPNFATESGLDIEIVAGGTISASPTLTLRRALAASPQLLELQYSVRPDGQLESSVNVDGSSGARAPLYLADPLAFLRGIIDTLTVAGVEARFKR